MSSIPTASFSLAASAAAARASTLPSISPDLQFLTATFSMNKTKGLHPHRSYNTLTQQDLLMLSQWMSPTYHSIMYRLKESHCNLILRVSNMDPVCVWPFMRIYVLINSELICTHSNNRPQKTPQPLRAFQQTHHKLIWILHCLIWRFQPRPENLIRRTHRKQTYGQKKRHLIVAHVRGILSF